MKQKVHELEVVLGYKHSKILSQTKRKKNQGRKLSWWSDSTTGHTKHEMLHCLNRVPGRHEGLIYEFDLT